MEFTISIDTKNVRDYLINVWGVEDTDMITDSEIESKIDDEARAYLEDFDITEVLAPVATQLVMEHNLR